MKVRHRTAPTPMGCRWCGVGNRDHAQQWVPGHSWHGWTEPTHDQIAARLRARLTSQKNGTSRD